MRDRPTRVGQRGADIAERQLRDREVIGLDLAVAAAAPCARSRVATSRSSNTGCLLQQRLALRAGRRSLGLRHAQLPHPLLHHAGVVEPPRIGGRESQQPLDDAESFGERTLGS